MAAPEGIDHDWAVATAGNLIARQGRSLVSPLLHTVARYPGLRFRLATGRRGGGAVDLEALRIPDSRLAKEAEAETEELLSPHIREHSYRTFLFGLAFAALDGIPVDLEMVYVASLLHDLHAELPTPGRCFAVVGAERAEQFALEHGADPTRARRIAAEISGHLTLGVSDDLGDPGGFVAAGAFADVAGPRLDELDPAWVTAVLERHPRLDFKRHVLEGIRAEARTVPSGRVGWLCRWTGFPLLIRLAPFDE
jgi:hypothetical protein